MRSAIAASKLIVVQSEIDPFLEVTEYLSQWMTRFKTYPTFQFNNIGDNYQFKLIMNLLKRDIILSNINTDRKNYLSDFSDRIHSPGQVVNGQSLAGNKLESLRNLPILKHQPKDRGRYITSFVGCLDDTELHARNLGFYRAFVSSTDELVVFMDPRTDAHRIVQDSLAAAREVPITFFNGGPLNCYLAAAAKIPTTIDSFDAASRFQAGPLAVDATDYPGAPCAAEIVIRGVIDGRLQPEAPFGEFKGYYCAQTTGFVVKIDEITARDDPYFLGLFCGKESGLTLMSLQNELLLFTHLKDDGYNVSAVRYPLQAFGEFLTLIESPNPSKDILLAAMEFDKRSKYFVVCQDLSHVSRDLGVFPVDCITPPYLKKGVHQGSRIGVICEQSRAYDWVEL